MANQEIATLWKADGTTVEVSPAGGRTTFRLSELQELVGGTIEQVPGTGVGEPIAYSNEEGRLRGLPFNAAASIKFSQHLVGDVIQVRTK